MADQWKEQLRCPNCSKTGMASLSQGDNADVSTVHTVSAGLKVAYTPYGPDFPCGTCDIPVEP